MNCKLCKQFFAENKFVARVSKHPGVNHPPAPSFRREAGMTMLGGEKCSMLNFCIQYPMPNLGIL